MSTIFHSIRDIQQHTCYGEFEKPAAPGQGIHPMVIPTLTQGRPGNLKTAKPQTSTENSPSSCPVFLIFISNPLWRNPGHRNTVVADTEKIVEM
jgi:hypothetical protein